MRISNQQLYETYSRRIQDAFGRYEDIQRQLSTGKKYSSATENPLSASISINIRRMNSRVEQFQKNLRGATEYVGLNENTLAEVSQLTTQAYTYAIKAASDAVDQNGRQAIVDQITALQERLVSLGNTQKSDGTYLFAGQKASTKPFTENAGALQFDGDTNPILVEVRPGEYMRANLESADSTFATVYNELAQLKLNLQNGDLARISSESVGNLKNHSDFVTGLRAEMGTKMNQIDKLTEDNTRRTDELLKNLSDNEDVDLAEAFVKYQQAQNSYQAALQVASQGFSLSLMDYLR